MMQVFAHFYEKIFRLLLIAGLILISLAAENFAHASSVMVPYVCTDTIQPHHYYFFGSSGSVMNNFLSNSMEQAPAALPAISLNRQAGLPTIMISSSMDVFTADVGSSHEQFYQVGGSGFSAGQIITLTVNDLSGSFTISTIESGYGTTVSITANSDGNFDELVGVNYAPAAGGSHSATIDHSGEGAEKKTLTVDGNATSLPVEWTFFKAQRVKETIVLEWATASEMNNSHFEIEISKDPVAGFKKIGRINSKVGSSKLATPYRFEHYLGAAAGTYFFRLKQVDIDNAFSYSQIIATEMFSKSGATVGKMPNPVTASSQLAITTAEAGILNMVILDMNGAEIYSKTYDLESGEHHLEFDINEKMPTGIYILTTEYKGLFNHRKFLKK